MTGNNVKYKSDTVGSVLRKLKEGKFRLFGIALINFNLLQTQYDLFGPEGLKDCLKIILDNLKIINSNQRLIINELKSRFKI